MSSTKRNRPENPRSPTDFYPTPAWAVQRFLEVSNLPGGCWLDPCAGKGDLVKASNEIRTDITWKVNEPQENNLMELRKLGLHTTATDYLIFKPSEFKDVNVIITNPPFKIAMDCIKKSFEFNASHVVFLLRLNFLASRGRAVFMSENTPDVYVLSSRPSFANNGKTDSIDYAWFVWDKNKPIKTSGKIIILPKKESR